MTTTSAFWSRTNVLRHTAVPLPRPAGSALPHHPTAAPGASETTGGCVTDRSYAFGTGRSSAMPEQRRLSLLATCGAFRTSIRRACSVPFSAPTAGGSRRLSRNATWADRRQLCAGIISLALAWFPLQTTRPRSMRLGCDRREASSHGPGRSMAPANARGAGSNSSRTSRLKCA
jgi:hypothetical protein